MHYSILLVLISICSALPAYALASKTTAIVEESRRDPRNLCTSSECRSKVFQKLQRLGLENATILNRQQEQFLNAEISEEPFYEFDGDFTDGTAFDPSILFRTLAVTFDWTWQAWWRKNYQVVFNPPNYHGLSVEIRNVKRNRKIPRSCIPWFLESTAVWMRSQKRFGEAKMRIKDHGEHIANASLTLKPPAIVPPSKPSIFLAFSSWESLPSLTQIPLVASNSAKVQSSQNFRRRTSNSHPLPPYPPSTA